MTKLAAKLLGNTGCYTHSCDTSGLGHADFAKLCVADLMQVLGHLRGLARSCFSYDDEDLVVSNRSQQVIAIGVHRQRLSLLLDGQALAF